MNKIICAFLIFVSFSFGITLDVPFVKQRSEFCGPAALSSVLRYYGINITQEKIAEKVHIPKLKGALITDLQNYAKRKGFKTQLSTGDIENIKKYIKRKIPVILLVDYGFWVISKPHYIVVIGYNEEGVIAHTGYEASVFISYKKLEKIWEKTGKVFLVVYR